MTLVASNWRFLFDYNLCAKRISVPFMAVNNKNVLTALTAYKKPAVKKYFFIINSVSQVIVEKLGTENEILELCCAIVVFDLHYPRLCGFCSNRALPVCVAFTQEILEASQEPAVEK